MATSLGSVVRLLCEFLASLGIVLWFSLVSVFKFFLPVQKKDVSKEIVLITGAGSGIGRLMALRFAELGAKVVLWDINKEANEDVAGEIKGRGLVAHAFHCDCSKREEIYQTAAQVKRDVGDVTILVNNAGIVTGKKFLELPDDKIDLTFRVNTTAHFWTLKAFLPAMMSKNHGYVITIASGAGLFGVPGLVDYCASKFGAVGIHESITSELSMEYSGVHTTCVCPYYIDTGMFDGIKTRFRFLLPVLTPEYAVDKIMTAFHANQSMLMMPRIAYLFYFLQSVLPKRAMLEAGNFLGVNHTMDTFRGRLHKD